MIRSDREILDLIHELVTDQIEEGARGTDPQSLQKLVSSDDRIRRLYLQYMQESFHIRSRLIADSAYFSDSTIANLTNVNLPGPTSGTLRHQSPRRSNLMWFAAVSAVVLVSGFAWLAPDSSKQRGGQQEGSQLTSTTDNRPSQIELPEGAVATLVRSNGAVRGDSGDMLADLSRLEIGQEIRIDRGSAELVFDSGVEALLLAPAQLKVLGTDRVSSEYGRFSARVGSTGVGFVIETPMARVTDLGTEFGVSIAESGQTEIAVFEGEVDLEFGSTSDRQQVDSSDTRERLLQGEAVRIDSSGARTRVVSIDDRHLPSVRQLPPVFQRLPAIGAVRDNTDKQNPSNRKFYRIVHSGFREDCQAFVDRPHQWNGLLAEGLPRELIGADYVMPFNDDKFDSDLEVEISVTRSASIYVFFSDNVSVPPWLRRDFEDTGIDIGLDEGRNRFRPDLISGVGPGESIDTVFSVWKQEVPIPRTVILGSVKKPASKNGYNMYGVAVAGH
ncbi:FecR domain-containing protein [Adhaeretor mobilis]|uniref:FecR protein n=1 Tax=Adhaeretor mobilis TaxID=1930276 RepID=A0A517N1B5_9BACT|nr:FecR family protein [Adhaeretor mobilis]QDT00922.1 FecR protein [Adhaeretor mobilis]